MQHLGLTHQSTSQLNPPGQEKGNKTQVKRTSYQFQLSHIDEQITNSLSIF